MKIELHLSDEEIYYLLGYKEEWSVAINTTRMPEDKIRATLLYVMDQIKRQWDSKRR